MPQVRRILFNGSPRKGSRQLTETAIQKAILSAVNQIHGCKFWAQKIDRRRRNTGIPPGTPDIIGWIWVSWGPALFGSIEAKTVAGMKGQNSNEKTKANQLAWRERAKRDGALHLKTDSAGEAVRWIQGIQQREIKQ